MSAARYVLERMKADPRLAFIMGPGSECYARLTAEVADELGMSAPAFRDKYEPTLTYQRVPAIGAPELPQMSLADVINPTIGDAP